LPEFYQPQEGLVETLQVVLESQDDERRAEAASKVRNGMDRDIFKGNNSKDGTKN